MELTCDSVGNLSHDKQGYNVRRPEQWKTVTTALHGRGLDVGRSRTRARFQVTHTRDAIYRMTAMVRRPGRRERGDLHLAGARAAGHDLEPERDGDGLRLGRLPTDRRDRPHARRRRESPQVRVRSTTRSTTGGWRRTRFNATWMATLPAAVQTFLGGRNGKGDVYAYDMAYRLVDARYDVTNPATEVQNPGTQPFVKQRGQYTIDGLGNRSQVQTTPPTPPTAVTYATDVVNQYTTVGGISEDPRQQREPDRRRHVPVRLRLREPARGGEEQVDERADRDLPLRRARAAGREGGSGGATTRYVLDGVQVVEEYDGSNAWQARYVYEDGIDQPRCMDRADIADVNGNANTTEVLRFHYHQQALGSVTEMTQPTGAVVEWVTYDVYGPPTIRNQVGTTVTQSAVGNPWLYTGREYDPESGLYFYRARTYDPSTGRFLQRDPLGEAAGLGAYEYSLTSPATLSDPLGLTPSSTPDVASHVRVAQERSPASRMPDTFVGQGLLDQWFDLSWFAGLTGPTWLMRYRDSRETRSVKKNPHNFGKWVEVKSERLNVSRQVVIEYLDRTVTKHYALYRVTYQREVEFTIDGTYQILDRGEFRARQFYVYDEMLRGSRRGKIHGRNQIALEQRVSLVWRLEKTDVRYRPKPEPKLPKLPELPEIQIPDPDSFPAPDDDDDDTLPPLQGPDGHGRPPPGIPGPSGPGWPNRCGARAGTGSHLATFG